MEGTIRITCLEMGVIDDLRIPCYVKDMTYPLFLNIRGIVKGVSVEYEITDSQGFVAHGFNFLLIIVIIKIF